MGIYRPGDLRLKDGRGWIIELAQPPTSCVSWEYTKLLCNPIVRIPQWQHEDNTVQAIDSICRITVHWSISFDYPLLLDACSHNMVMVTDIWTWRCSL